jgi:hypothetical protein
MLPLERVENSVLVYTIEKILVKIRSCSIHHPLLHTLTGENKISMISAVIQYKQQNTSRKKNQILYLWSGCLRAVPRSAWHLEAKQ